MVLSVWTQTAAWPCDSQSWFITLIIQGAFGNTGSQHILSEILRYHLSWPFFASQVFLLDDSRAQEPLTCLQKKAISSLFPQLQTFHLKSTTILPLIKCEAITIHVHSFQNHFNDEPQTTPTSPTCLSSRHEFPTPRPCPSGWMPRTSSTWQNSGPHSCLLYKPASPVSTPHLI